MFEKMSVGISIAPSFGSWISGKASNSGAISLKLARSQVSLAPPFSRDWKVMSAVLGRVLVIASSLPIGTRIVPGSETAASVWQERLTSRSVPDILREEAFSLAMMMFCSTGIVLDLLATIPERKASSVCRVWALMMNFMGGWVLLSIECSRLTTAGVRDQEQGEPRSEN